MCFYKGGGDGEHSIAEQLKKNIITKKGEVGDKQKKEVVEMSISELLCCA